MSELDPEKGYVLLGDDLASQQEDSPPKAMLVRLSAALLEAMLSIGHGESPMLAIAEGEDMYIRVGGEDYHLQQTVESSPHQLYSISKGQAKLRLIGNIVSKLHLRQEGNVSSSSTAATRLKERKEMEEARKAEHRTVLIDAPLLGQGRSKGAKLKLRPKGLAPSATNSPLIRSRGGTPIEAGSVPGSPTLPSSHLPAKTPPTQSPALPSLHTHPTKPSPLGGKDTKVSASPTNLKRRMIQILAKGPTPRRNIVQQLHHPEPEVLPLLDQIAEVAPDYLQPPKDGAKKYSGPVNRRGSTQSQLATSVNGKKGETGPGTVYILKDILYREVLIQEWAEYSNEEMQVVSEHAKDVFTRLKLSPKAEEWKRLHLKGHKDVEVSEIEPVAIRQSSRRNSRIAETSSSLSDLLEDSPRKGHVESSSDSTRSAPKKDSVFSRINKASKSKGASAAVKSKNSTANSNRIAKKSQEQDVGMQDGTARTVRLDAASSNDRLDAAYGDNVVKRGKETTKNNAKVGAKPIDTAAKMSSRKEIEYTDSSNDDEEMQIDADRKTDEVSKRNAMTRPAKSSSEASEGQRQRRGVGSGAGFSSEPWLDVRNHGDWKRLAERFKRVYEEYSKGRLKLREEERMIKAELEMAHLEHASLQRSIKKGIDDSKKGNNHSENDLEEGEASPTNASDTIKKEADPILFHNVKWKHHADQKSESIQQSPMSIEELTLQIRQIQELEAQLNRMKGRLQSSRKSLEAIAM